MEDESYKQFCFTSESRFGAYTETGLNGKVRLWKDGLLEQDFFSPPLCQVTGKIFPDNGKTEWQIEGNINIRRGLDNKVVFDPQFRKGIFKITKGKNYVIEDGRARLYEFSSEQLYSAGQIRSMNKLRGRIWVSLNKEIVFREF